MEKEEKKSVTQEEIHGILFNREIDWQEIIYDLINTEQLDPWNINITTLANKYLEKIRTLEEADFFISSKVLLASSLLLRIKSEFLLNKYIKSIDEILFGKKEEKEKSKFERIELEDEIPELIPKSPMPRVKKVTLSELMNSLNKAINTENRRIKKVIINKNALREAGISLPKKKTGIKDRIKNIFDKLKNHFKNQKNIPHSHFIKINNEKKIESFQPLLQLEHQKKIWLHQENHFDEIYIWDKKKFWEHNGDPFDDLKKEEIEEGKIKKKATK